jgi:TMEM175 potassium channel family protein
VTRAERTLERSSDFDRLITFVDAIVAVAITLLILPLVDLAGQIHSRHDSVVTLITAHSGQFWAFGLSFIVIARLWLAQHQLLRRVIAASRAITLWLLVWALAIVVLPFPTALLPVGGSQAMTKVLYIGTLTLSSGCLTGLAVAIKRNPQVRDGDGVPAVAPAAASTGLLALALVLSLTVPHASYYPLLLLLAGDWAAPLMYRLRRRLRPARPSPR